VPTTAVTATSIHHADLNAAQCPAPDAADAHQRVAYLERLIADLSSELAWANERLVTEMYDRSAVEAAAERLERNDPVTGLPNRRALEERLAQALAAHARSGEPAALVSVGLGRLAQIRESFGLAAGDRVLRVAADRLRRALRGSDVIARVGDHEFALLLTHLRDAQDAALVARKLFDALDTPVAHEDRDLLLRPAVGVALYPQDADGADLLLARADAALRHARDQGGTLYQFFEPGLTARATRRLTLEADLRAALERDEFCVVYQPRFDAKSGRLTGAEALLRWQHPERGLLAPAEFLDVAESTGLIVPIGERVLRAACAAAAQWSAGVPPRAPRPTVSVNLSPREFRGRSLPAVVAQALADAGLDGSQLQVELAESSLATPAAGHNDRAVIEALRGMGVKIALDGFGSASLTLLRRLPVDCVKIDGEFVRRAPADKLDALVVSAVASVGRRLGLRVVASGVETEQQLALIKKHRCHEVQGYLLGEPVNADRFGTWLAQAPARRKSR
jgi:diguanylate cyclase (GGDEF)-like protein